MARSKNYNYLENFLRKHLQNYRPAENGWNNPPDEIWEQVAPKLASKRRPFGFWFKLGLLALVIFGLVGYQFYEYKEKLDDIVVNIEAKNVAVEQALTKFQNEIDDLKKRSDESTNIEGVNSGIVQKKDMPIPSSNFNKNTPHSITLPIIQANEIVSASGRSSSLEKLNNNISNNKNLEKKTLFQESSLTTKNKERVVQKIPVIIPRISTDFNLLPSQFADVLKPLPIKKKTPFSYLKLVVSKLQTKRILTNVPSDYSSHSEHNHHGFTVGLDIGWELSKRWSIESGVHYLNYASDNHQFNDYLYESDQEFLNESGLFESAQNLVLNSGMGLSATELLFSRNPLDLVNDGQKIDLEIFSQTKIKYLQFPVQLAYKLTTGRVQFSLKGGLMASMVIQNRFEANIVKIMNAPLNYKEGHSTAPSSLQKFHISYLAGIGLEYRFSPNWSICLEPTYSRSITLQAFTQEDIQIYLSTIGLFGGIKLRF